MAQEQLLSKSNYEQNVIKKESLEIQYGLSGVILRCCVTATKEHILIETTDDEKSKLSNPYVCIKWSQLINIDDLNDKNELHSFQLLFKHQLYPNIYIYCDSKNNKQAWIKIFEKMCPTFILTKELQTVKRCAANLGFSESQIEAALIKYHEKHSTVYNVHVFIGMITENGNDTLTDTKNDDDEDDIPKDLQCCICHKLYTKPVTNIYAQTYCYGCIVNWFENITNEQTTIKDPYTNQPLPQHCRLLMPCFNKMILIWNDQNDGKISDLTKKQLQNIDNEMNKRRKKILNYLQKTENCAQIATKLADQMLESDTGTIGKTVLNDVMEDAMKCYEWLNEIKNLIKEGSDIYNNAITQQNYSFKWDEPEWKHFIDKNSTNWADVYQVDDYLLSQIEQHTTEVIESVTKTMNNQQLSTQQIKDEILRIILQKQSELRFKTQNQEEKEAKKQETVEHMKKMQINMERIMYSEKHGLVNTKCITEIAECIKNNKAFELYHNDWNHKTMNRDQLVRFLQTAGREDGIENQYLVYKSFAMGLKDKMFRLSSYLKTTDEKKFKKFQYFRYLKSVDVIEQEILNPKQWNAENDRIELKIKFDCDYDAHLKKYNNDPEKLGRVIKQQMIKQLKIKGAVHADKCIVVNNVQKGSIELSLWFFTPLIATVCGACDFIYCGYKHRTNPNYYISTKRSILQGMAVGGGIGAVAAAKIAVAVGVTATAGIIGCAVAGAVVGAAICGLIGWGIWKLLKKRKRARQNQINLALIAGEQNGEEQNVEEKKQDEKEEENEVNQPRSGDEGGVTGNEDMVSDPEDVNGNREQLGVFEEINQPRRRGGGGQQWISQFSINIDDVKKRIRQTVNGAWIMVLDCNCEIDYKQNVKAGSSYIKCEKHDGQVTDIQPLKSGIKNIIEKGVNRDSKRAISVVRNIPQTPQNEFNTEESDSDET
eukprot:362194_1